MTATDEDFSISRTFDAPRDVVWRAFTEAEHLKHWWGPKGFRIMSCTLDLRPGGRFHYGMQSPGGQEMWGLFLYREVEPQERLVFTNSFSDPAGNITRAWFSADFPLKVLNVWTFVESGGRTTVSMRGTPHNASSDERAMYAGMHDSMRGGYGSTLDQLAVYLARRP